MKWNLGDPQRTAKRISLLIPSISLIFCFTVYLLWLIGNDQVLLLLSAWMKQNTSIALTLASLSAILLSPRGRTLPIRTTIGKLLGLATALIGFLTLVEYFFQVNLAIDQIFRLDPLTDDHPLYPGRMAPNAAALIFTFGMGLFLIDKSWKARRFPSTTLFIVTGLFALVAEIGYLYQANALYQLAAYIRISQYTAAILFLLSLSMLVARPNRTPVNLLLSQGPEGILARRLIPSSVLIPIILCWAISKFRSLEIVNRPTGYSLLASLLIVTFAYLIWRSAEAIANLEQERRRILGAERIARAEAEHQRALVQESQSHLELILKAAQVATWDYNLVTGEIQRSENHSQLFGFPQKQENWDFPRFLSMLHPEDKDHFVKTFENDLKVGPEHRAEFRVIWPDGSIHWLASAGQIKRNLQGNPLSAAGIVYDITKQKHSEESLRKALAIRDEFLSIASHELKTPLTTLKLQAQMRRRALTRGEPAILQGERLLKMIHADESQIERLSRLIDDMLDVSRITGGRLAINRERFNLSQLAQEVADRYFSQFEQTGGKLILDLASSVYGEWDRFRIEQVITNLLSNALKYGQGKPVFLRVEQREGNAVLEVEDQGHGISVEDQERIFQKYERAVSANEISGLGLGLYIVREILKLMDANIKVRSVPGHGSVFTVTLPLHKCPQIGVSRELQT